MSLKCEKCGSSEKVEVSQVSKRGWWPWIIGGGLVGLGLIIGLIVWLTTKKKNEQNQTHSSTNN